MTQDEQIVAPVMRQLSWTHFTRLLPSVSSSALAKKETIELLELEQSHIRVAEYMLELPPKETLARKLHAAIQSACARLGQPETENEKSEDDAHASRNLEMPAPHIENLVRHRAALTDPRSRSRAFHSALRTGALRHNSMRRPSLCPSHPT